MLEEMSSMSTIKMDRAILLTKIKENLTKHQEKYLEMVDVYKEEMIDHLNDMIKKVNAGEKVSHSINLPVPTDYSSSYEDAIEMLSVCVDKYLMISDYEFKQYVLDKWDWKKRWDETSTIYSKAKR